jgi:large subunit ribosomal protein L29
VKVDELRVLEADELGVRLKTARRELYELRFKHAVGQLENSSQISKVRHDIARIMTVLTERNFGIVASAVAPDAEAEAPVAVAEPVEEAPVKPKRTRKKAEDKS